MIEFYLAGMLFTAAYLWRLNPPRRAEWVGLAGMSLAWPALLLFTLYHAIVRTRP